MSTDWDTLRHAAATATANSHSPFSGFPVGAAGRPLFSCAAGRSPLRPVTRRAFVVRCLQDLGRTALIWAAGSGKKEVVQVLIDKKADVKAKDTVRCCGGMHTRWRLSAMRNCHAGGYGRVRTARMARDAWL